MTGRFVGAVAAAWLGIAIVASGHARPASQLAGSTRESARLVSQLPRQSASPAAVATPQRALLDKYCVTCHNKRTKTADLMLDSLDLDHVGADAEIWEKVIKKLAVGAMPPAGRPRPDKAASDQFISWLETSIDTVAHANPNPGRPTIHRLNRAEYVNVIRDLLGLEIDGESMLPADTTSYGFDNIADVLSLSPSLLDRYMSASRRISQLAIGENAIPSDIVKHKVSPLWRQEDRLSNDVPAGSRGGALFEHNFPTDGEYVLRTHFIQGRSGVRGDYDVERIDIRLDGVLVKKMMFGGWGLIDQKCGGGGAGTNGRQGVGCQNRIDEARKQASAGEDPEWDGIRVPVKAGEHLVSVTFQKKDWVMEGGGPTEFPVNSTSFTYIENTSSQYGKLEMGVDSVDVEGPFNALHPEDTPSRRRILTCHPAKPQDEASCAKTILATVARRAYRRAVTDSDVKALLGFYNAGREGKTFAAGIQHALAGILINPEFLFRIERDPSGVAPGGTYQVSDLELASRLSFFLWSSIPDDELLNLAEQNKLKDSSVLDRQIQRMLGDPRSQALIDNFFGQWLSVRSLKTVRVDPYEFPEFDDNLREAFQRETDLFIESQLRENRGVMELLTANYTFVNERLARHYGIPNVFGTHFRRVTLSDDRRAGLLGQGSILMMTSYANRTSPVLRGKWVLDNVLGVPPPPPPANVPPFPENQAGAAPATVRERMEQHRKNPVCANCHAQIDPPGFALENFNAIGAWRTSESGRPIDSSGAFYGSSFADPVSFRKALLQRQDAFVTTLTEKLLTYALGRGAEYSDMPAIRQIVREASADGYHWSSLLAAIAKSTPFRMTRASS